MTLASWVALRPHHVFSSCLLLFLSITKSHSLEAHRVYQYHKFTLLLLPALILCYFWVISMSLKLIHFTRVSLSVSFKASARPCKKSMLNRLFVKEFLLSRISLVSKTVAILLGLLDAYIWSTERFLCFFLQTSLNFRVNGIVCLSYHKNLQPDIRILIFPLNIYLYSLSPIVGVTMG